MWLGLFWVISDGNILVFKNVKVQNGLELSQEFQNWKPLSFLIELKYFKITRIKFADKANCPVQSVVF